jgi:hypothetical protein
MALGAAFTAAPLAAQEAGKSFAILEYDRAAN